MPIDQVVNGNTAHSSAHSNNPSPETGKQSPKTYTILIVDDDNNVRFFLSEAITTYYTGNNKVNVIVKENASEVVTELKSLTSEFPSIDLIFTDLNMPNCNGYMFIEMLRIDASRRYMQTPIVVITGEEKKDIDLKRLKDNGVPEDQIQYKPFGVDAIEKMLERYCPR